MIDQLDQDQSAAVTSTAPFTLVCASPGAGKTRVLVERIRHKIATGTHPRNIVAFTFTNAGANEMAKRLGDVKLCYIGTIHGFCFRLLQKQGSLIGYREGGINMIAPDLATELLKQVAAELRYKGSDKKLLEAKDPLAQLCHKEYRHRLKRNNLVDYDGCLVDALHLIKCDEDGLDIEELLLDEAQDSAVIDWEIVENIGADSIFVVGDPDQSIFGFRGAWPQGFVDAAARGWDMFKLERNYRSGDMICAAASQLIAHNQNRIQKQTRAVAEFGTGLIEYHEFSSDSTERGSIVHDIQHYLDGGKQPSDIAILTRTNALAAQFCGALEAAGIPVKRPRLNHLPQGFGHALDVLSLFADPRSDILAGRIIKRLAPDQLEKDKRTAREEGNWLSEVAFRNSGLLVPANLEQVSRALSQWQVDKETCDLIAQRIALLPQPEPTLTDLRHDLFAHDQWTPNEERTAGVTISTVHSAKGKEWDVVFVVGLEDEDWPGKRNEVEEMRRLLFVAITRGRSSVHLSSAASRVLEWGGTQPRTVSWFIAEMNL